MTNYLIKPIFQAELLRGIAVALQRDPRPEPEPVHRASGAAPQPAATCPRILLVEDNPINQVLVVSMLEKRGYEVTVASDGAEALDVLTGESFDLVLMDVQMPGMGGLEATRQIRAREQSTGRHVPIIAMTARAMVGDRDVCLEAGMDAYLAKPIDRRTMLSLVAGFLGHLGQGRPTDEGEIEAILDPGATLDRVDGDLRLFREIRQIFFSQCPERMQAIRRALDEQDPGALADAAHGLRNSLNNFAAPAAAAAALRLEQAAISGDLTRAQDALATLDQEVGRVKMALSALVIQPPG